ncbi:hypothetical protein [Duffyella gerundensis]|uniref:hypothetical protein n=1 Tax=Duffyella TaxID=3026546 RepID=UPI003F6DAFC1
MIQSTLLGFMKQKYAGSHGKKEKMMSSGHYDHADTISFITVSMIYINLGASARETMENHQKKVKKKALRPDKRA